MISFSYALTYSVKVPTGTNECYIAGEMNNWTHQKMNKIDETHYTIDLPNVKSIGSEAFEGCRLLATVDAPKVQKVGAGAFFACDSLKEDVPRSRAVRNDDDR